jgi:hypothetical protein
VKFIGGGRLGGLVGRRAFDRLALDDARGLLPEFRQCAPPRRRREFLDEGFIAIIVFVDGRRQEAIIPELAPAQPLHVLGVVEIVAFVPVQFPRAQLTAQRRPVHRADAPRRLHGDDLAGVGVDDDAVAIAVVEDLHVARLRQLNAFRSADGGLIGLARSAGRLRRQRPRRGKPSHQRRKHENLAEHLSPNLRFSAAPCSRPMPLQPRSSNMNRA